MKRRWSHLLLFAVLSSLAWATPAAAAIPVGAPIETPPELASQLVADTWRVAPLRVADPAGGPDWGLAAFERRDPDAPRTIGRVTCLSVGRVVGDELGAIDAAGVFHAFRPTVGAIVCGGGNRLEAERYLLARGNERPCVPGREQAQLYNVPACAPADVRSVYVVALGDGILSAVLEASGGDRPLSIGPGGTFMTVQRRLASDRTGPSIRVTATLCGPAARLDLKALYGARARGCTLTFRLPATPRPARESAASRRARRAKRLDVPVRVAEHSGTASRLRFVARFHVPITIRRQDEGYAYRLAGPGGPRCDELRGASTAQSAVSGYLHIEGRLLRLALLPLNGAFAGWCPGRYRLEIVFSRSHLERDPGDAAPHRVYDVKRVGVTHFHVAEPKRAR